MAKKQGDAIARADLGKAITNGNADMANYSVFAVTVQEKTVGYYKSTFVWSRSGSTEFGSFCHNDSYSYYVWWSITLSGNTFSCQYSTWHNMPDGGSNLQAGNISQVRGIG